MSRRPVSVRVFLVAAVLALTLLPLASGSAAWLIEGHRQDAAVQQRVRAATAYLTAHRVGISLPDKGVILGMERRFTQLHILVEVGVIDKGSGEEKPLNGKKPLFASPSLGIVKPRLPDTNAKPSASWRSSGFTIPISPGNSGVAITGTLFWRPPGITTRALIALGTAVAVLLAGLAITVWLVGRWIVNPLSRLSIQVDKIAGGELSVAAPPSRITEVANVAAAIDGMATALGETGKQQAAADDARRFLVAAVAHDLRTPLFALRGHLEAIASDLGDPDEHLAKAEERAASLERLIASFFTYARHDYAPQDPLLEAVVVSELLRRVAAGFRGGEFVFDGDDDLAVVADREQFERVLVNVFDNALRHGPPGQPVDVAWFDRGQTVEVTITDRGPGIDAALLPHVFEPMVRGDLSRHNTTGGAGLGLTIAKRLIESQGGTIAAANRPDGGAELTLTVRRADFGDRERAPALDAGALPATNL